MEIILAKLTTKEIQWKMEWGGTHTPGELVKVGFLEEFGVIEDFDSYNNVISLMATLTDNDWEMQMSIDIYQKYNIKMGDWIYAKETEFGGIVENIQRVNDVVKLSGANFRGYLTRHIITPPYDFMRDKFGDYIHLNEEANNLLWVIWELDHSVGSATGMTHDPFVLGLRENTEIMISDKYRYDNYLSALTKSLRKNNMRLETKQAYIDYDNMENQGYRIPIYYKGDQMFVFSLSAKPIKDYSNDDLFSQDYDLRITSEHSTQDTRRFLWCLGSGEMEDREIVVLDNGVPTKVDTLATVGSLWNSSIFDYPNAESREELIKAGQERFYEKHQETKSIELFVDNSEIEFYLGDIIGGEDFLTGIKSKNEIVSKELNISNGRKEIRYKIGGN